MVLDHYPWWECFCNRSKIARCHSPTWICEYPILRPPSSSADQADIETVAWFTSYGPDTSTPRLSLRETRVRHWMCNSRNEVKLPNAGGRQREPPCAGPYEWRKLWAYAARKPPSGRFLDRPLISSWLKLNRYIYRVMRQIEGGAHG